MSAVVVFTEYLAWTYGEGIREFLRAWGNYHWFMYHFFSMNILARTLVQPWHRIREVKMEAGFDPQKMLERLVVNTVTRLVGLVVRVVLLFAAAVAQTVILALGILLFVMFLTLPVSAPGLLVAGVALLFI